MNSNVKKGSVAIADQALFSGSNFLVNLFLVKILSPDEYGAFGSLYSLYILIFVAFAAVFLEPYMYYKNKIDSNIEYTSLYAGFSNNIVLFSFVTSVIGIIAHSTILIYISYILTTCILYFYKRHFFAILHPEKSLHISIVYFLLMTSGLVSLNYFIKKDLFNSFLILNAVSLLSLFPSIILTKEFKTILIRKNNIIAFLLILKQQKKYSFHCLSSSILSWIPNNIYFVLIPVFFSNGMNAQFKALQNVNLPIYHFNIAVVSMLVPVFMKTTNVSKIINKLSFLFIIIPLVYLSLILLSLDSIENFIYDNKYSLNPYLIIVMITGIILEIVSNIYKAYFRSIEKPNIATRVNLLNAVASLLLIYFVYAYGLNGAIGSYLIINIFNLASSIYFYLAENKSRIKPELILDKIFL